MSTTDPGDSYHAHQAKRQVYVVLKVEEGDGPLANRIGVVAILRRYEEAQALVDKKNAEGGKARHLWQVAWIAVES